MANRLRWAEAIEPLFGNTFIRAEPLFSRIGARLQKYAGRKPVELTDNSQLRQCSVYRQAGTAPTCEPHGRSDSVWQSREQTASIPSARTEFQPLAAPVLSGCQAIEP